MFPAICVDIRALNDDMDIQYNKIMRTVYKQIVLWMSVCYDEYRRGICQNAQAVGLDYENAH